MAYSSFGCFGLVFNYDGNTRNIKSSFKSQPSDTSILLWLCLQFVVKFHPPPHHLHQRYFQGSSGCRACLVCGGLFHGLAWHRLAPPQSLKDRSSWPSERMFINLAAHHTRTSLLNDPRGSQGHSSRPTPRSKIPSQITARRVIVFHWLKKKRSEPQGAAPRWNTGCRIMFLEEPQTSTRMRRLLCHGVPCCTSHGNVI